MPGLRARFGTGQTVQLECPSLWVINAKLAANANRHWFGCSLNRIASCTMRMACGNLAELIELPIEYFRTPMTTHGVGQRFNKSAASTAEG